MLKEALDSVERLEPYHTYSQEPNNRGLGLAIGIPFLAVDLDKCYDPETKKIDDWALEVLKSFPKTYTELSPSRRGFHLWYRCPEHAKLPDGIRTDKAEVYSRDRYFTMTGEAFGGVPEVTELDLAEAKRIFDTVAAMKKAGKSKPAPIQTGTSSAKLQELMTRTDFPDLSAAVQSLLTLLAIDTLLDPVQMELRFKLSKLYLETHWREKWDRLGQSEIAKAINYGRESLAKFKGRRGDQDDWSREPIVVWGDKATREHARYWWEPYFPQGKLVHFGGPQSSGKSPVTIDLAARLTSGADWPDGQKNTFGPRKVLLLNVEDDFEDTILPRFDLAGGKAENLGFLRGIKLTKEDQEVEVMVALDRDISQLVKIAESIDDLALIIIDPISNYLGKLNMNREDEVRSVLTPLVRMAGERELTILTVGHFNRRDKGTSPLDRMMGAAAFTGVARAVYAFGSDPDVESPYHHIIAPARGAVGDQSLKYHTEVESVTWGGETSKVVKVLWDGSGAATAEDAVEGPGRRTKVETKAAADALHELLKGGKRSARECISILKEDGYDLEKTLNASRVRHLAGVKSRQEGKGNHVWYLSTGETEQMF